MTHWSDYSLRGWLSFLAFMHIGLCLRSFLDQNFLSNRIYLHSSDSSDSEIIRYDENIHINHSEDHHHHHHHHHHHLNQLKQNEISKELILAHHFGIHSMIQAFVLIQSAIHLYITPVQTIVMFLLTVFIIQNVAEIFYFKTMDFWGATLLPLSMSVITLIWMILFHLAWKPWFFQSRGMINEDETKHCLSLSHQFFQSNQSINKRIRKTNRYLDMKRFESLSSPLSFSSALPSSSSSSPSSSSASKFRSDNLCFNFTGRLDSNPMIRIRPFTSVKTSNESTTPSQSSSSQKTKESHID